MRSDLHEDWLAVLGTATPEEIVKEQGLACEGACRDYIVDCLCAAEAQGYTTDDRIWLVESLLIELCSGLETWAHTTPSGNMYLYEGRVLTHVWHKGQWFTASWLYCRCADLCAAIGDGAGCMDYQLKACEVFRWT